MEEMGQAKQAAQTGQPEPKQPPGQARRRIRAVAAMTMLYAIQFIILPLLLSAYFPGASNEASALFWLSSALALILGFRFADRRLLSWLIADAVYFVLILLYCAEGAYGIGLRGLALDGMHPYFDHSAVALGALICLSEILAIQLSLLAALHIGRHMRH